MKPSTPRRLLLTAAASFAALAALPATAHADHLGGSPLGAGAPGAIGRAVDDATGPIGGHTVDRPAAHRLTVTVSGAGAGDGTYTLECAPTGGTHPSPDTACERLDQLAAEGANPFEPVPRDALCTQQYGGPETARVRGDWHGRPVDATFSRTDGCQISRWNNLVPVLPVNGG
ncbi:SSI family serine proteinase inhibitor [Streptomyces flavofungini]|uniref:SSI family serine proteinase inhibitor n=1 Tax=Streptomyces flavofungini TaxID=68200 RepID=UPI0025B20FEF|nr:SSI family serine proteinase inhibitor [Streptomyces flavofungini]WJV47641.1 SSI family serine proteinase inhibitor [Streptomyces flavofungini]